MQTVIKICVALMLCCFFGESNSGDQGFGLSKVLQTDLQTGSNREMPIWWRDVWQMATAPKILYKVEKLECYRNGVWAEFSMTNKTNKRIYIDTSSIDEPVEFVHLTEREGREWEVPHFKGNVDLGPPDSFVALDSGKSIEYRSKLSLVSKPIRMRDRTTAMPKKKPIEMNYRISLWWGGVYSELTADTMRRIRLLAIGSGKVPIEWIDKEYPKEWGFQKRKY